MHTRTHTMCACADGCMRLLFLNFRTNQKHQTSTRYVLSCKPIIDLYINRLGRGLSLYVTYLCVCLCVCAFDTLVSERRLDGATHAQTNAHQYTNKKKKNNKLKSTRRTRSSSGSRHSTAPAMRYDLYKLLRRHSGHLHYRFRFASTRRDATRARQLTD